MKFVQPVFIAGHHIIGLDIVSDFLRDVLFADGQHQHLIVGQQALADGIVE